MCRLQELQTLPQMLQVATETQPTIVGWCLAPSVWIGSKTHKLQILTGYGDRQHHNNWKGFPVQGGDEEEGGLAANLSRFRATIGAAAHEQQFVAAGCKHHLLARAAIGEHSPMQSGYYLVARGWHAVADLTTHGPQMTAVGGRFQTTAWLKRGIFQCGLKAAKLVLHGGDDPRVHNDDLDIGYSSTSRSLLCSGSKNCSVVQHFIIILL